MRDLIMLLMVHLEQMAAYGGEQCVCTTDGFILNHMTRMRMNPEL